MAVPKEEIDSMIAKDRPVKPRTMRSKPLTVVEVKAIISKAQSSNKLILQRDSKGLRIRARPTGTASWELRYFNAQGKEQLMILGTYPEVSLEAARGLCLDAKRKLKEGIDIVQERRESVLEKKTALSNTFEVIAREWLDRQDGTPGTIRRRKDRLEKFVIPEMGSRPIAEITTKELLTALRKVEAAGKLHTVKRVLRLCNKIWSYAVREEKCQFNVCTPLNEPDVFKTKKTISHAAITKPDEFAVLLRKIDTYTGSPLTVGALKLISLCFTRPGELRQAEWAEFDLDNAMWVIPAQRMKMRKEFMVPLSKQAVEILRGLKPYSTGRYMFPSSQTDDKPMSENTMNHALRRMGYTKDVHVSHGFRVTASTLLHELEHDEAVIELQLAHKVPGIAGIYNRAAKIDQRKKLVQEWADYLDKIKAQSV